MTHERPLVGVFDTSVELADLLGMALEGAGYLTINLFTHEIKRGPVDLDAFLKEHDPKVIVYDIAIPYKENWRFFQEILAQPAAAARRFVLTTTNKNALDELVGGTPALEIIGKPFDLQVLLDVVRRAFTELKSAGSLGSRS